MTILCDLIATRALIEHPDDWTKGTDERCVIEAGAMHFSYCLTGAVRIICECDSNRIMPVFRLLHAQGRISDLVFWNDDSATQHIDVLDLLDRCIAGLSERKTDITSLQALLGSAADLSAPGASEHGEFARAV